MSFPALPTAPEKTERPTDSGPQTAIDAQVQARVSEHDEIERRVQAALAQRTADQDAEREAELQKALKQANEWPSKEWDGPAPWDLARKFDEGTDRREDEPYLGPCAVTHSHPTLTYGAAGPEVAELVRLLAVAGYRTNSVIEGKNPSLVLDTSVMADVKRFAQDYNVANDHSEWHGKAEPAHKLVDEHVGPYIWQALLITEQRRREELTGARK